MVLLTRVFVRVMLLRTGFRKLWSVVHQVSHLVVALSALSTIACPKAHFCHSWGDEWHHEAQISKYYLGFSVCS